MEQEEIAALLARCSLGDRAAFGALYERSAPKLLGVAMRILGARAEAEEALQEAYVKIWNHAGRYQPGRGSASGWLVAVVRNQAIDALRARKAPARQLDAAAEIPDARPGPEASALASDERRRLADCLEGLQSDRAAAVRAAYMEGYSYEELARRHGVPLNTMRTWLRRALISLRECLGR
jgi:RNA polymerase sigma-70 factor (ECF subfamily)